ncbi:triple tyrosine motif-containing protein [Chitinophaga sp. Hz27]|uniref:triple tyrosine motif-containing protein n=1 Tax=Chitinophaga sp. Hz27 TaxID=3347169 RepID=UPI0035DE1DE8
MNSMRYIIILVLLISGQPIIAQNTIGLSGIANYDKSQYHGNGQTWDIDMDQNGIMYFANNDGLISFNGSTWNIFQVPNKTRVRSVKVGDHGRIYVGAQDEFGYFKADDKGELQYTSLKPKIPADKRQFADVWNIVQHHSDMFFRTPNKLFKLDNKGKIDVFFAKIEWKALGSSGKNLYAEDHATGLYRFENNSWQPFCTAITDKKLVISAFLDEQNDTLLVATIKDGLFKIYHNQLYPVTTAADHIFRGTHIYCGLKLSDHQYAIGTFSNGCYIIDLPSGKVTQQFSRDEGMQNNNVLRIFADGHTNLWMTLENGIDKLQYDAPVKYIVPDRRNVVGSYTAAIFQHQMYIGTTDGLYSTPLDGATDYSLTKGKFTRIPNTAGQIWNLSIYGDHLLMGHQDGTFEILNNKAVPLLKDVGSWIYQPIGQRLIIGNYIGLAAIEADGNTLKVQHHIDGLYESLRFLAPDGKGNLWSSHPYRGIYHLVFVADSLQFKVFGQKEGLPTDNNNFVFTLQQEMVAATTNGIYEYNRKTNRFQPSAKWAPIFKDMVIKYLREDNNGNVWFVSDKKVGLADITTQKITWFPELTGQIISGFEFIYPYNDENIFMAGDKGIIHLNYKKYAEQHGGPTILFGRIMAGDKKMDSVLYGGYDNGKAQQEISLPNAYRNFRFEFSSPAFAQNSNIHYSYQLRGYDKEVSDWADKTEKEYTNLPFGHYTFMVIARDNLGKASTAASYSFYIEPAWYQTWLAWTMYILLFILLIYFVYVKQQKRLALQQEKHQKEQEQLIIKHQLELERNEMQLIRLRNENLQADVQHKNKELATAAMNIVQKGKVLSDIKEAFLESIKKLADPTPMPKFRKVMKLFEEAENNEDDWAHFSQHFDQVHNNYLLTLKKKFPELTTTDLKLCAYLRINLTTKEIAQTMGISVRGVETSRYRLRKKLDIPGETNLYDFLMEVAYSEQ